MYMNQFAETGKKAIELYLEHVAISPREAWQKALDGLSYSANVRKKSCPRNTFLGLCSEGLVSGIPQKNYNSPDNKERIYAQKAVDILRKNPSLSNYPCKLWAEIGNDGKSCDSQMEIVIALWKERVIK
jgi:hypothetical protein